jgi:hypothetical protein
MALTRTSTTTSAGDICALIRDRRDTTRTEIGQLTGLSRTAISARVTALTARGLVIEREHAPSTGGRPATFLTFNADAGIVLSAAIGRSRTRTRGVQPRRRNIGGHRHRPGAGPPTGRPHARRRQAPRHTPGRLRPSRRPDLWRRAEPQRDRRVALGIRRNGIRAEEVRVRPCWNAVSRACRWSRPVCGHGGDLYRQRGRGQRRM